MFKRRTPVEDFAETFWANVQPGEVLLRARGITKRFPGGVVANDHVDFEIRAQEVHALLGENGAGKTTLMSILFGLLQPDEGEIELRGQPVRFHSPQDAIRYGIGMVHQHRKLVPAHTVLENILLGHPKARGLLNEREAAEEIAALAETYGFKLDLYARVWQLTEGEKQAVEIVKALYRGAHILIMDEPTSALTPVETDRLLEAIERMTENNLGVVPFITHKMPIIFRISDRVTILRRGRVVATLPTRETNERELAQLLVGREVLFDVQKPPATPGDVVIEVENVTARNDKGGIALDGVSFSLRAGQVLGIAGVAGNGQHELAEVLAGLRPVEQGRVRFLGRDITNASVLERWRLGIGYTPAERTEVGSIGEFTLVENVALNYYWDDAYVQRGFLNEKKLRALTESIIETYQVVTPSPDVKAKTLSGGNLQKVIMGRVLSRNPKLVIANLPAQGLDIGATEFVQRRLLDARAAGAAVILISEELDEILMLSDIIAPMYEGRIVQLIPAERADKETVGAMIAGGQARTNA
ncbi:simple sugar transport system ATP-binding protein [Ardenticatena maritima]|uniref:Simple sugar transport system ATP-binding protein n=1 Tax=Ardenticatena maritima TaxID=872965 RepID=A0A0M8K8H0_9CHLR|nr:ABC transporter ATP-binding protein [Ardenticatena maritima]GAP63915.1 simple sugar transport system ATP-binding protein [Ardenticatena maritima]